MTKTYRKQFRRLVAAILSAVLLLCACVPPQTGSSDSAATPSNPDYEVYRADDLTEQKRFDAFTNQIFKEEMSASSLNLHFTLADPQAYGIPAAANTFGEFTLEQMQKNFKDLQDAQKNLKSFQYKKLNAEQKLTCQILASYFETELTGEGLELYQEPLSDTIGIQAQLPILLAEYSFYSKADVDTYLELLSDIDRYFEQLVAFEKQKSTSGLFMSDAALDSVLASCQGYLIQADHSILADTFNTRLDAITDLTEEEKSSYKEQNLKVLTEHFIPAYELLADGLTALRGTGKNDKGLYYYPQGKQYFEYLVNSNTGMSYESVEKLVLAMQKQFEADLTSMAAIAQQHPEVIDSINSGAPAQTDPDVILTTLQEQIKADFPPLPQCSYTVKYVPEALQNALSPAFYLVPAIDRYQDNVIYINPKYSSEDIYYTLAHEGYPGHLYQSVYFLSSEACSLRHILSFPSYSEGWATYVERYSYGFDNGKEENVSNFLGYNSSTTLGLYAILDVYINYEGWDREKAKAYLNQFYSINDDEVTDSIYDALIANPTNYMEYYVGYMEIMGMKNTAQKVLGDKLDMKAFHTFLLDTGPAPFSIIVPQFNSWLRKERAK